mgnify:FL=1
MNNAKSLAIPKVVLRLLIIFVIIQLLRSALPPDWDAYLLSLLGFNPFRAGGFQVQCLYGAVTSIFVHGGWWHLISNAIWMIVISPQILRHIEGRRYLTLFVLTGALGALVHALVNWGENAILIGASGAVFGLLGAGAFVLIRGEDGFSRPSWRDILKYILVIMLVNVGYALLSGGKVSWEAHAGGFFAGMALFPFLRRTW